jgi:ribosomal protein S18 acetylase RimI-like enzyme
MAETLTQQRRRYGGTELVTAEQLASDYTDLKDCDPELDIAIIEADGEVVAYCRCPFRELVTGPLDLITFEATSNDHRSPELFAALVAGMEQQLLKWIDRKQGAPRFVGFAPHPGPQQDATMEAAWFEAAGYTPSEWGAELRRPNLDDLPDLPLPDGIEVRPAVEADLRTIIAAYLETFRGEWDFSEPTEQDYIWLLDNPHRDETLWQVAWDGDTVVGQVKPFINADENAEFDMLRGYTEYIGTHHDYRNQGIAGALLARALIALRERGMTEAVLSVDTNNPGGAFQLYTKLGFELQNYSAVYTKPAVP